MQKSNRLSTKQDHCSSQKSLVFKKNTGRKGNSKKSTKQKHECPSVISNPKTGAARSACARVWRHSAHSCEEETLWLVPSLIVDVGEVACQTASRPGGGCRGLQVGGAGGGSWGYGRGSQHGWFSTLATLRPWHNRRCRNSRSVREKFFKTQNWTPLIIQVNVEVNLF